MNVVKQISKKVGNVMHSIAQHSDPKSVQLVIAILLTISLLTAIPVYAWFSNQRKAAEMFKVDYPNALYINAAQREDQVQFELGGININAYMTNDEGKFLNASGNVVTGNEEPAKITKKQYVFSVSGSNADKYILQMAHTTNNLFTYRIYEATQLSGKPSSGEYVKYTPNPDARTENPLTVIGDDVVNNDVKYYLKGNEIVGEYKNKKVVQNETIAQKTEDTKYYPQNFKNNSVLNDNVEEHVVPLYWQTEITGLKSKWDTSKRFCSYYILEVTWENRAGHTIEDKETDLIYFSVKRTG